MAEQYDYEAVRRQVARRLRKRVIFYAHLGFYSFALLASLIAWIPVFRGVAWYSVGTISGQFSFMALWTLLLILHAIYALEVWQRLVNRATEKELERRGLAGSAQPVPLEKLKREAARLSDDGELVYDDEDESEIAIETGEGPPVGRASEGITVMVFGPLLPVVGAGLLIVGTLLFWAAIQNWLADLLARWSAQLGRATSTAQSALVILDRVIVNGQRVIVATLRAIFGPSETEEAVTVEEVKTVRREDLPADVLLKLERGEPLQYELSVGSMRVQEKPGVVPKRVPIKVTGSHPRVVLPVPPRVEPQPEAPTEPQMPTPMEARIDSPIQSEIETQTEIPVEIPKESEPDAE